MTETRREGSSDANEATSKVRTDLRALPAVSAVLLWPAVQELVAAQGRNAVTEAVRRAISEARLRILLGEPATVTEEDIRKHVRRGAVGSLRPVLNATGIIVHTNLGRAPLAQEALDAVARVGEGYATLEYDLDAGQRGDRSSHVVDLLRTLTGAEDALVVNNNAAAALLALSSWAVGREVIVSRGELVEIGGGFRIPDVLAQSGARLVEVGTTNRTRLDDYARAIRAETSLLLKVHRSNFEIVGYTQDVSIAELSSLAKDKGLPLFYDAGSGALEPGLAEPGELPISSHIRAGADVVTFSGDKLLGGPQAGVIVGTKQLLEPMRRHALMRAVRLDKLCIAALAATLLLWRDEPDRVPVVRMLRTPVTDLSNRAQRIARAVRGSGYEDIGVVVTQGRVGGGAAPSRTLESRAVRVGTTDPEALCRGLRRGEPPVVARIEGGAVLVDLRCVPPERDVDLAGALVAAIGL